jgi:hypothetical protein
MWSGHGGHSRGRVTQRLRWHPPPAGSVRVPRLAPPRLAVRALPSTPRTPGLRGRAGGAALRMPGGRDGGGGGGDAPIGMPAAAAPPHSHPPLPAPHLDVLVRILAEGQRGLPVGRAAQVGQAGEGLALAGEEARQAAPLERGSLRLQRRLAAAVAALRRSVMRTAARRGRGGGELACCDVQARNCRLATAYHRVAGGDMLCRRPPSRQASWHHTARWAAAGTLHVQRGAGVGMQRARARAGGRGTAWARRLPAGGQVSDAAGAGYRSAARARRQGGPAPRPGRLRASWCPSPRVEHAREAGGRQERAGGRLTQPRPSQRGCKTGLTGQAHRTCGAPRGTGCRFKDLAPVYCATVRDEYGGSGNQVQQCEKKTQAAVAGRSTSPPGRGAAANAI